jgi:two-component system response regulator PilR (NtrC family)
MQVKLLRAIQERRVRKVGATVEEPVDVRILSATHQDLAKLVAGGRFRQDLYYRLNVIELRVPSLRSRADDIVPIARAILQRLAARNDVGPVTLSPAAEAALKNYHFPGNVRELENVLERALALAGSGTLEPIDLMLPVGEVDLLLEPEAPAAAAQASSAGYVLIDGVPSDLVAYLDRTEADAIRAALAKTRNNRTAAAQLLGITFRQLRYRMQRLGLK